MGYERTHSFQKKKSLTPQPTTQFASRPFAAPIQRKPQSKMTPDELENEAFNHNKFEAFGLQLKEKNGTITPVEQERLGVLQAKMDDFWAQRREKASRLNHDYSKIPVQPPEGYPTPQLQPMGMRWKDGVAREDDTEEMNSPLQMSGIPIQAKLTIGEPGDKYEQEADAVAARVVEQIQAPATAQSTPGQSVQREEEEETEEVRAKPEISALQRKDEPLEEEIQGKFIQKVGEAKAGGEASTDLESAINRARGGGQPLDASLQQSMGQAMGADLSGVRVHTDAQSDQLNQSIQAKAFTTGQDVFFRQGAYEPGSRGGQELIAHELTHVVQQNGGAVMRKQLQRLTIGYTAADLGHPPVVAPTFANTPILTILYAREKIPSTTTTTVDGYHDCPMLGNYNHHVGHQVILDRIRARYEGQTRNNIVMGLTEVMARLAVPDPLQNPGVIPMSCVAAFNTWLDNAIVQIVDCPRNIFRGAQFDGEPHYPETPTPALTARLNAVRPILNTI